eukprot:Lithocolla_globosa_v1_NODE_173_length_5457_cov_128.572381.p3 type:complete len:134 gc:universal NODE_173_length_5457_cov_128.572381:1705-1304(-)
MPSHMTLLFVQWRASMIISVLSLVKMDTQGFQLQGHARVILSRNGQGIILLVIKIVKAYRSMGMHFGKQVSMRRWSWGFVIVRMDIPASPPELVWMVIGVVSLTLVRSLNALSLLSLILFPIPQSSSSLLVQQ